MYIVTLNRNCNINYKPHKFEVLRGFKKVFGTADQNLTRLKMRMSFIPSDKGGLTNLMSQLDQWQGWVHEVCYSFAYCQTDTEYLDS